MNYRDPLAEAELDLNIAAVNKIIQEGLKERNLTLIKIIKESPIKFTNFWFSVIKPSNEKKNEFYQMKMNFSEISQQTPLRDSIMNTPLRNAGVWIRNQSTFYWKGELINNTSYDLSIEFESDYNIELKELNKIHDELETIGYIDINDELETIGYIDIND